MQSFLDWQDTTGFYTKTVWDIEQGKWTGAGKSQFFPFQRRILGHCFTPDAEGNLPYSTIVYSTIKKSGKTSIEAAVFAWAAECAPDNSEIYLVANDQEQARARAFEDIKFHAEQTLGITVTQFRLVYPNGTFIQALANQYSSAAGARQFASGFDELWAYISERGRRMWAEMTPPPTVPNSFRFIATYAGFEAESDQLMELYNTCWRKENGQFVAGEVVPELADIKNSKGESVCRRNGKVFVYWDSEPRLPWQTPEYYEEQMMTLRPTDFLRMHRNQWVSSNESFIPIELWDRAAAKLPGPATLHKTDPRRTLPITVGVDIGLKHDCSALVGVYYDIARRTAGLAFHRIWTPLQDGSVLDLEATVEAELLLLEKEFKISSIVYDPSQFQRSAVTLARRGMPLVEFPQSSAGPMTMATQVLYDLLKTNTLEAYPDPELRDHIRYATAQTTTRGFRLTKGANAKYKIDAAVALAMALYDAINNGGIDVSEPIRIISPFADASAIHIPTVDDASYRVLPEALRD